MKLWLLRHTPVLADPGLCYGRTDVPVSPTAVRDAASRAALILPSGLPARLSVRSSPRRRCAELAAALQHLRPELQVVADARLAEMDFGDWEGQRWDEIPRSELDAWSHDFGAVRAGGTGESTRQFMARVALAYEDWLAGGEDALWVTHAGVIRALWLLQGGVREVTRADQWPAQSVPHGELLRIKN
jgi:alpha-ribazole phosphatase